MIVYGLVIVAAAWLAGRTRSATAIRKAMAPSLRDSPALAYLVVGRRAGARGAVGSDPGIAECLVDPRVRGAARGRGHDAATRDRDRVRRDRARPSAARLQRAASPSGCAQRCRAGGARRVARATGRASRSRRDQRRRVRGREDTRHQQRHLRPSGAKLIVRISNDADPSSSRVYSVGSSPIRGVSGCVDGSGVVARLHAFRVRARSSAGARVLRERCGCGNARERERGRDTGVSRATAASRSPTSTPMTASGPRPTTRARTSPCATHPEPARGRLRGSTGGAGGVNSPSGGRSR